MFLSDISIKRPILISMVLIVFVMFGALSYSDMNLELTPEINMPMITIQTIYGGASPVELETQVSKKIEDAIASISGINYIQSYSMESVSFVLITFDLDKDVYEALQEVKDKVDGIVNNLPEDAELPLVQKFDPTNMPVVDIVLSGELPMTELYDLADKKIKVRFSQLEGVANVNLTGGQEREIRVELDNKTVLQHSIPLTQLTQILTAQNMDMPGGNIERFSQEYSIRLNGQFPDIETIREIEIPTANGPKQLGDLATITDGSEDVRERITFFNKKENVSEDNVIQLSLMKTSDGNAVEIYREVQSVLPEIIETLPEGCSLAIVDESSTFVEAAVEDTLSNILLGIILTSLVLLFFLHDYKSTIIVALSMPMSIFSTFLFMKISGFTLNVMSLMGLSTAVGILVTNSVVVLENIFRHKSLGEGKVSSASKGTAEIAVAVLASTLTNLVVFLPLGTMSSLAGRMFSQFSLTVVYATIFSLIMSFTLTPMLASLILPEHDRKKRPIGRRLEQIFSSWERGYKKLLNALLTNKFRGGLVILGSVLLLVLMVMLAGNVGFEFIPPLDEGKIGISVDLPTGYKLDETAQVMRKIETRVLKHEEVSHLWTQLGRQTDMDRGTNLAMMKVKLVPKDEREASTALIVNELIHELSDIPNAQIRVNSIFSVTSGRSDVEFNVVGQDLEKLDVYQKEILRKMKEVPGLINAKSSASSGKPEIKINPYRHKLYEAGLTIADVAMALRSSVAGVVTTSYKDRGEEYDIRVMMNDQSVDSPEKLGNIPIVGHSGTYRLEQLAEIQFDESYSQIVHLDRYVTIKFGCDVGEGYVMGDLMKEITRIVDEMDLPAGYELRWGQIAEEMENTTKDIVEAFIIALVLTYMLLAATLESLTQPLLILGTVPLAMVGVFGGLLATGLSMNIISMLAIVMLLGIVVNNAILLLDYTNILVRQRGMKVHDALLEACPTKLKPILMSSIAIILGMLPMAMGLGSSGAEMRQPMGVVSIGGLLVSTVLSLIVIPVLYNVVARNGEKKKAVEKN